MASGNGRHIPQHVAATSEFGDDDSHARRAVGKHVLMVVGVLFAIVAVVLFWTEQWLFKTWAELSFDEIAFHLQTSLEGTNRSMITDYLTRWASLELVTLLAMALLIFAFRRSPRNQRWIVAAVLVCCAGMLTFAVVDFDRKVGFADYVRHSIFPDGSDFIGENYVDPNSVAITFPDQKRNLVYLFLESMEITYADAASGGAFDANRIPELTRLAQDNECFAGDSGVLNGGVSLPGTNWTTGGMFGQLSGTPLKIPLANNAMARQDSFFPGMAMMGDILAAQGYRNLFMLGSESSFSGKNMMYDNHGFEIFDLNTAYETGAIEDGYHVFWGFEDQKLFGFAQQKIQEMADSGQPFALALLTVDTHFEDGYVCELCGSEFGDDQYSNVMVCSSRQVAQFVDWVLQQPFGPNTTIVLCGDHPTMDADYCAGVSSGYQRKTYTAIVNGAAEPQASARVRNYATVDMFPTALAALGATIEGNRLGLGTNLYSSASTIIEEYGLVECQRQLSKPSHFLDGLSGVRITQEDMDTVVEYTRIDPEYDDAGKLVLRAWYVYHLNKEVIQEAYAVVTDTRTGTQSRYDCAIVTPSNNPKEYEYHVATAYTADDLPYLTADFYVTVEGFSDYLIGSYPSAPEQA